jgi:hypothetical protein
MYLGCRDVHISQKSDIYRKCQLPGGGSIRNTHLRYEIGLTGTSRRPLNLCERVDRAVEKRTNGRTS